MSSILFDSRGPQDYSEPSRKRSCDYQVFPLQRGVDGLAFDFLWLVRACLTNQIVLVCLLADLHPFL